MALTEERRLRMLLGERIPRGGAATDTFFSEEEIEELLALGNGSMNASAAVGWAIKAGEYAPLVEVSRGGGTDRLQQRFDHADRMMRFYANLARNDVIAIDANARISARVASILSCDDGEDAVVRAGTPFLPATDTIRYYPLYRFPSVLR